MTLRIVVADDEPHIVTHLKNIIEEVPDTKVVMTADNGIETIKCVNKCKPNAIFLDINMPDISGLDIARDVARNYPGISIVFVTGYSDYALEAYEIYAIDYILKPFKRERVHNTIQKLKERVANKTVARDRKNEELLIDTGERKVFINPGETLFVESRKPKIFIKTVNNQYLAKGDLHTFENILLQHGFFRSHKGYIVNLEYVKEIMPSGRTFEMILTTGDKVLLSRKRERVIRNMFKIK